MKKAFDEYVLTIEKLNVQDSNAFLNEEIELIFDWADYHQKVLENIDSYPVEYSRKYAEIRSIFNDGLDDLQKTAQEFMNGGVSKILCGENEKHWVKVRHIPQSSGGWHPVNDNLM